jgi:hypothetical protein
MAAISLPTKFVRRTRWNDVGGGATDEVVGRVDQPAEDDVAAVVERAARTVQVAAVLASGEAGVAVRVHQSTVVRSGGALSGEYAS